MNGKYSPPYSPLKKNKNAFAFRQEQQRQQLATRTHLKSEGSEMVGGRLSKLKLYSHILTLLFVKCDRKITIQRFHFFHHYNLAKFRFN